MSIYETDIWRIGVIKTPIEQVIAEGVKNVHWLEEEPGFSFLADPFGIKQDGKLYIFAENYSYKDRHGRIEVLIYDESMKLMDRNIILDKPWHLSYPIIIQDGGSIYMLPEAYKSGQTTLYKATNFPYQWGVVSDFSFPDVAIDPSVFFNDGLWWMFYTPADSGYSRQSVLSVAFSETLVGTWQLHPLNPVRITPSSSRSGGSVIKTTDGILLPTQDCTKTYGGGINFLNITELTPNKFSAHISHELRVDCTTMGGYCDGIHTLSKLGDYTLVDAKKIQKLPCKRLRTDIIYQLKMKLAIKR